MISKIVSWGKPANQQGNLFFVFLFALSLPFKNSYTNIVILSYSLYIIGSLLTTKHQYIFARESLLAYKYLLLLFACLGISLLYTADLAAGFVFIAKFIYLLLIPLLFCFIRFDANGKRLILLGFVYANFGAILFNFGRACVRSMHMTNGEMNFDASVLGGQTFWYSIVQGGNYFFYDQLSYFLHPTYWGIFLLICVFVILGLLKQAMSGKSLAFFSFLLVVFFLAIFLCSSRIVILSAAILLTIKFVIYMIRKRSFLLVLGGTTIILIMAITLTMNPRFVGFKSLQNIETFHHSRLEAWKSAIDVFKMSPVFGVGIGDSETMLFDKHLNRGYQAGYENKYNEHNQYLQIANASGLLGLSTFLLAIGVAFRESFRHKDYLQFAFIFSFALVCLVENFLVRKSGDIYFAFFYCLLFMPSTKESTFQET